MTIAHQTAALTAERILILVGRLRETWTWLEEQLQPGPGRYHERRLTDSARIRLDRLTAAERLDRVEILRNGTTPEPPTQAPINLGVADARSTVHEASETAAYLIASTLRLHAQPYRRAGNTTTTRVASALDYIAAHAGSVTNQHVLEQVERDLADVDRNARIVCGVGPVRRLIKSECPACGRRSLVAEVGSPIQAEWAVICDRDACRCRGSDCVCHRALRVPGSAHHWPKREWGTLSTLIGDCTGLAA